MPEEGLEQFEKSFPELLNDKAAEIDPTESRRFTRKGLGKAIDVAILLRRGFEQAWQFIVIIQALFIFLGLSPQVSDALRQLGISLSGTAIGLIALGGIAFFFIFGLILLLYGGTQRSSSLINEKQAPAQRLNYSFYQSMSKWAMKTDKKLEKMEEKLEKLEEKKDYE